MIPLQSAFYSKNFKKIGIVLASVNILFLEICLLVIIATLRLTNQGFYIKGTLYGQDWFYAQPLKNTLIDAICFVVVDIILYMVLIFGLRERKPVFLTIWLIFSVGELIVVQIPLFIFTYLLNVYTNPGLGVLSFIVQVLVTVYLFFNMCVVFSAREEFTKEENLNSDTTDRRNTPPPPYRSIEIETSQSQQPQGETSQDTADDGHIKTVPPQYNKYTNLDVC